MNNSIVALIYGIGHEQNFDYSNAEKMVGNNHPDFCVLVEAGEVRFQFKIPMEEAAARKVVNGYIDRWEFFAGLKLGPGAFGLRFKSAEFCNDESQPKVHNRTTFESTYIHDNAQATLHASEHPPFPSEEQLRANISDSDVQFMYQRYINFRRGREPLAGMAYFCLTTIQRMACKRHKERQAGRDVKKPSDLTKLAAEEFGISKGTLRRVKCLSSEWGGQEGRKAEAVGKELTSRQRKYLECAVIEMIEKAAAAVPGGERES